MRPSHGTLQRCWLGAGLSCLVCLTLPALVIAQTETSPAPKKPAQTSTAAKAKHSPAAQSTKHTSPHTAAQKTQSSRNSPRTNSRNKKSSKSSKTAKKRGQQVIDTDRARSIQEALIREHYMQGEPSGTWDSATQGAMQKYQAAQGWQSKTTPDSRALIKLGLGPSHDHLLNPESAMTSADPKPEPKSNPANAANPLPKDHPQH